MGKRLWIICAGLTVLFIAASPNDNSPKMELIDVSHSDSRNTPKLQFNIDWESPRNLKNSDVARTFLLQNSKTYQLPEGLENLKLREVKNSLLGSHYYFQQKINGVDVEYGEVIVSVDSKDQSVFRVFNNTYPQSEKIQLPKKMLSKDQAYDRAWQSLRVHGKLMAQPKAELFYVVRNNKFRLVYITHLTVKAPYGAWKSLVDAQTGEVIEFENTLLPRKASAQFAVNPKDFRGKVLDRKRAFSDYEKRALIIQVKRAKLKSHARANGTGVVFDPDPRTSLMDNTIQDDSPASAFEGAYFTRPLRDLSKVAGQFTLTGPWVQIVDFDSPSTEPSTTEDGNWTAKRGDNSFNDAMTYYHLDRSQRYMQGLGFVGDKGIQAVSIEVDADGVSGADNSYFSPSNNHLSFGHGCVDDNEDADVILHEYGHAIHHSINSNWSGGDTGAMGEGFGDYWAGSYSISTPNGRTFRPNEVFSFDAHGEGNPCWSGRILNATDAKYDADKSYGAHSPIPGGYQSDELWSTPLFQTLLKLTDRNASIQDVDKIVLEAHFGLGYGVKMPEMAKAILQAARNLYPDRTYDEEFLKNFVVNKILDVPQVELVAEELTVTNQSGDPVSPGDDMVLSFKVRNNGDLSATNVVARVSINHPELSVDEMEVKIPNIGAGSVATSESLVVALGSSFPCGDAFTAQLELDFDEAEKESSTLEFDARVGQAMGVQASSQESMDIPDNDESGVTAFLDVESQGVVTKDNFNVEVNLEHTYTGDVKMTLIAPEGTEVLLHNRTGSSADDIVGSYPSDLKPHSSLESLAGLELKGRWGLKISDHAGSDTGMLKSWGIRDIQGYQCRASK